MEEWEFKWSTAVNDKDRAEKKFKKNDHKYNNLTLYCFVTSTKFVSDFYTCFGIFIFTIPLIKKALKHEQCWFIFWNELYTLFISYQTQF